MKIRNLLCFILFFFFFFLSPSSVSAQCTVKELDKTDDTIIEKIFTLFFGWLTKTDYSIKDIDQKTKNKDMTEYSDVNDENFKEKQAFAGSRSQSANNQICLKGNVIKQTILSTPGYNNSQLAQICLGDSCSIISVNDLAHFFVQTNQKFYCDEQNKLIDTESNFIEKVNSIENFTDSSIPESKISCYQKIYNEFYITPKDNADDNEENAKKMVRTAIPANNQDKSLGVKATKTQVDKNFCPQGVPNCNLNNLRPANW